MTCQPSAVLLLRLIFTGIVAFLLPYLFTGEALSAFSVCALVLRPLTPGLSRFYQLIVSSFFCPPPSIDCVAWRCSKMDTDGYSNGRADLTLNFPLASGHCRQYRCMNTCQQYQEL